MASIIPFNEALKQCREQLGISQDRAAVMLCLSDAEYCDLEAYEYEWRDVVPCHVVRHAVSIFAVDWRNALEWPSGGTIEPQPPLDTFLKSLRESLGLTRDAFGDRVGFFAPFVEVIEGHPDGLALWPLDVALDLASVFDIKALALAECVLEPRESWARIAAKRQEA